MHWQKLQILQLTSYLIGLIIVLFKRVKGSIRILFYFHEFFWKLIRWRLPREKLLLILRYILHLLNLSILHHILMIKILLFGGLFLPSLVLFLIFIICNWRNRLVFRVLFFNFRIWTLLWILNAFRRRRILHVSNRLISRNFNT